MSLEQMQDSLLRQAEADGVDRGVVGAIVHDAAGRVLLLRRSGSDDFLPGIEELPSGGIEPGESPSQALARELAEEIGWNGPVPARYVGSFDYRTGSGRLARQWTCGLPHDGEPIALSSEHTSYRWANLADIPQSDVTPETLGLILSWARAQD